MDFQNMSLGELFAAADEIGNKYVSKEDREKFAAEMADNAKEIAALTKEKAIGLGKLTWAALTSEKAQHVYRSVLLAIVLTMAVIGIGLAKAAQHYWAEFKPVGSIVIAYTTDQAKKRARVARAVLQEWRRVTTQRIAFEWQTLIELVVTGWQGA
jgi:hypothetical protein